MNQINIIKPYLHNGLWMFDDPAKGLIKEALLGGTEELIAKACELYGIKNPENGFVVIFSKDPFPEAKIELTWVREHIINSAEFRGMLEEYGIDVTGTPESVEDGEVRHGNIYSWEGIEGYLCPALEKYFKKVPKSIHVHCAPLNSAGSVDFDEWYENQDIIKPLKKLAQLSGNGTAGEALKEAMFRCWFDSRRNL